jgi:hypothetical protein
MDTANDEEVSVKTRKINPIYIILNAICVNNTEIIKILKERDKSNGRRECLKFLKEVSNKYFMETSVYL